MKNKICLFLFMALIFCSQVLALSFYSPTKIESTNPSVTFTTDCTDNSTIWVNDNALLYNSPLNTISATLGSYGTYYYQGLCSQGYDPTNWQGLVAYYKLGKDTVNTNTLNVSDSSGNNNNGVIQGVNYSHGQKINGTINSTFGKYGNGWSNDGNIGRVKIKDASDLFAGNTTQTVCLYAYIINNSNLDNSGQTIFSNAGSAQANRVYISKETDQRINMNIGATQLSLINASNILFNNWYYICIIRDAPNLKALGYINGNLINNYVATINQSASLANVNIGSISASNYFNGSIDSVLIYNRALSQNEITTLYNNTSPYTPITDGLVLQYAFENGNATHTYDEKTMGVGKWNEGMGFNGNTTSSYINLSNVSSKLKDNDFSISGWYKASSINNDRIFTIGNTTTFLGAYVKIDSGNNYFSVRYRNITGNNKDRLQNIITTNTWYNFVITYSNRNLSVFIDGDYYNSYIDTIYPFNNSNMEIGFLNGVTGAQGFFNGSIDEVMIFNRSLSQNEITALYNFQNKNYALSDIGYYRYHYAVLKDDTFEFMPQIASFLNYFVLNISPALLSVAIVVAIVFAVIFFISISIEYLKKYLGGK